MEAEVKVILGELPVFWDKSVVFVVNLHSLFFSNQELTKVLEREVTGLPTYGGRVLPIINLIFQGGNNLVILEAPPDQTIMNYVETQLEIKVPEYKIVHQDILTSISQNKGSTASHFIVDELRNHPANCIDGFVTDKKLTDLSELAGKETLTPFDGSKNGNNKLLFHNYLVDNDLPYFDTCLASSQKEVVSCLRNLQKQGYEEAVLKAQIGASGCGLGKHYTTSTSEELFPEYFFFEGPCMVQGWLDGSVKNVKTIGSPSVQMFLSDTDVSLFDLTEQLLSSANVHEGNISPPPYLREYPEIKDEMIKQAIGASKWLHKQGYRGTAGIDYLVVLREGKLVVIMNEINARITGATYPSLLARYFVPHCAWIMRNIKFQPSLLGEELLSRLADPGFLFKKNMTKGILPFNFNLDENNRVHKGQFLFLASEMEECERLLGKIDIVFPNVSQFDRD